MTATASRRVPDDRSHMLIAAAEPVDQCQTHACEVRTCEAVTCRERVARKRCSQTSVLACILRAALHHRVSYSMLVRKARCFW